MKKFNIGDVVKPKFLENSKSFEFFIIVDSEEVLTKKQVKGTSDELIDVTTTSVVYEIMCIYPVKEKSKVDFLSESQLALVGSKESKEAIQTLKFVEKERTQAGITGTPDFVTAIKNNVFKNSIPDSANDFNSTINYDKLETVDEMLDALNTLQMLYDAFGDEGYIQLREGVLKNLKKYVHKHGRREKKKTANK